MTLNEPRMASGDEAAKDTWDRAIEDLRLSRLDRLDGLGSTVVRMGETPRLQELPPPVSASSMEHPFVSVLPVEPPRSKVSPFIGLIVGLAGLLALLVSWMGGAA